MTQRVLLMSSSRKDNLGYLEHAEAQIHAVLKHEKRKIVFVPYAAVTFSFDAYEGIVKPVFDKLGYALEALHHSADPRQAIEQAEAIAVGGGNTFALLKRMYDADIVDAIRAKVRAGTPYIGWSAGSNVACPTIRTTNDMPIVQPPRCAHCNWCRSRSTRTSSAASLPDTTEKAVRSVWRNFSTSMRQSRFLRCPKARRCSPTAPTERCWANAARCTSTTRPMSRRWHKTRPSRSRGSTV